MLFPSASVYGASAESGTVSDACGIVTGKYAKNGWSARLSVSMKERARSVMASWL